MEFESGSSSDRLSLSVKLSEPLNHFSAYFKYLEYAPPTAQLDPAVIFHSHANKTFAANSRGTRNLAIFSSSSRLRFTEERRPYRRCGKPSAILAATDDFRRAFVT